MRGRSAISRRLECLLSSAAESGSVGSGQSTDRFRSSCVAPTVRSAESCRSLSTTPKGCVCVLELSRPNFRVIRCCGRPKELDGLDRAELCGRIAPDELIVLVGAKSADGVLSEIAAELGAANEAAIVLDHTDALHMIAM